MLLEEKYYESRLLKDEVGFSTKEIDDWIEENDKLDDFMRLFHNTDDLLLRNFELSNDAPAYIESRQYLLFHMFFDYRKLFKVYKDVVVLEESQSEFEYDGEIYQIGKPLVMTLETLLTMSESTSDSIVVIKYLYTAPLNTTELYIVEPKQPDYEEMQRRYIEEALNGVKHKQTENSIDFFKEYIG